MQRKLLTNGNVFKRTDGRWGGVVWYMDEQGNRKRKSFSTVKKAYVLLNEYFRTMYLEAMINKNPMDNVEMIKRQISCRHKGKNVYRNVKQLPYSQKMRLKNLKLRQANLNIHKPLHTF